MFSNSGHGVYMVEEDSDDEDLSAERLAATHKLYLLLTRNLILSENFFSCLKSEIFVLVFATGN